MNERMRTGWIIIATAIILSLTWSIVVVGSGAIYKDFYKTSPRFAAVNSGDSVENVVLSTTVTAESAPRQLDGAINTLRVYGRNNLGAAFPYAADNYQGPFALANAEAPLEDFVQFNPAIMLHDDKDSLGQFGEYFKNAIKAEGDASEKVHLRMWYVPRYPEPRGLTYPEVAAPVYNPGGDIVLEYTYILLDPGSLDPRTGPPQSTQMVFPMAGVSPASNEQPGLDRMDVNGDGAPETLNIDKIVGVMTGTVDARQAITLPHGVADDQKNANAIIEVSPAETLDSIGVSEGGQVQFFDYMVQLEGVSLSGEWADVSIWYIGNDYDSRSRLGTIRLGMDEAALVGRFWGPPVERFASETAAEAAAVAAMVGQDLPARPFWVTLDSIVQSNDQLRARLTPHRLLMTGETFFVDSVEYDVAAILVEDADLDAEEIAPEIKYITIRNPLPKGEGYLDIPDLTIEKRRIPADTSLWVLPPFNYEHDMVDDVNIPEDSNNLAPDEQELDNVTNNHIYYLYDHIAERIVLDAPPLGSDSCFVWIIETKERRFDTNLLEEKFIQTRAGNVWNEDWQWINIETMPWLHTEFILPELPDKPTEAGFTTGDYILVSSFLTEDSTNTTRGDGAVRVKFAYDAKVGLVNSADIYVNDTDSQNTLRVYGHNAEGAAFPYAADNYQGPFALANAEAPLKDFVQFNPAIMLHNDENSLGQFGEYFKNAIRAAGDASEKVHLRMWYVPWYPEPRGLTYPEVAAPVYNPGGDIVLEYTYILLNPSTLDPQTGPPQSTQMVFPMAGVSPASDEQPGLDRMDVNGDGAPETLNIDQIVGVMTGTVDAREAITLPHGVADDQKNTNAIIEVSPGETLDSIGVSVDGQVQFFDYMVQLDGVSFSGEWADVSIWYIGNDYDSRSRLGTVMLEMDEAVLVGRFWGPPVEKFASEAAAEAAAVAAMVGQDLPARPFWVTLNSIVQNDGQPYARLTPHRLLMTGETFFVDCVEYDVAAILVEDADLDADEIDPEIKYITIRNPLPKGSGLLDIPELTVEKCKIPADTSLWMLPPFNYEHDMADDVNILEDLPNNLAPDAQEGDNVTTSRILFPYDLIAERIVPDVGALDGDLFIGWTAETKEVRFDTNLLEEKFIQTQGSQVWDEDWHWINIETMPWLYTEFILPELPDKPTVSGYTTGDYILVSSFLTEDSTNTTHGDGAVRVKFAYDAEDGTGIYVNTGFCSLVSDLRGRVKLESASYQTLALTVTLVEDNRGIANEIASTGASNSLNLVTDISGYFNLSIDPGAYDVWVQEGHALAKQVENIVIAAGTTTEHDFGELIVSDADNNNLVDIRDFGVWKNTLLSTTDLRADFNLDRQITSLDFGWIKKNFGKWGDDSLTRSTATVLSVGVGSDEAPSTRHLVEPSQVSTATIFIEPATSSVTPNETFTMAIKIAAGAEEVDSADAFVNFDPTHLEVTDITGSGKLEESGKTYDNDLGEIFYGVADLTNAVSGTFTLATITFRTSSTPVAETSLTFNKESLRKTTVNSGITRLPLETQSATVGISLIVSIEPSLKTVRAGDVFTLEVKIEAGTQQLDGVQVYVDFDPAHLSVTEITSSQDSSLDEIHNAYDNVLGQVEYAAGDTNGIVSGTFTLAAITFQALAETVETPTTLSFHTALPRETLAILGETPLNSTLNGGEVVITKMRETCHIYLPLILRNYPPTYTISGQVMDADSDPAPGVTISSDAGHTTTTDSEGNYAFSGLGAGTYTITPSKSDYTFEPVSRAVSVSPNAAGQDFVATPVLTPTPCTEGIANGGFEDDGDWELPVTGGYTTTVAHDGDRSMFLGIMNPDNNILSYASAQQETTIPTEATSATLRLWLYPMSEEPGTSLSPPALVFALQETTLANDVQYVIIRDENDILIDTLLWQRSDDQAWTFHEFDLTAYAGQTIKLNFGVYNDGQDGVTAMYLDDVALEICYP